MYRAIDLAKYIVSKCAKEEHPISNLQLQKILYFIQRKYLQTKGKPAFPEDIEAWQFGPVVPDVYYFFCGYGSMDIDRIFNNCHINDSLVDGVVNEKCIIPPWDLVKETHKEGGAWFQTFNNGNGNHHTIPLELIKNERS